MRFLLVLSKENVDLAKEEVLALIKNKDHELVKNFLFLNRCTDLDIERLAARLAYTNDFHKLLFECSIKDYEKAFKKHDFEKIYKKNFSIELTNIDSKKKITEKQIASMVWDSLKNPKVKLKGPDTPISVFLMKTGLYCCLKVHSRTDQFMKRRSHLRPKPSPISLHPKLARAMVNLTGAKKGSQVMDPFCGSGGILIEAGMVGMKVHGSDINRKMVWKSMENLEHFGIESKLQVKDFFDIKKKCDFIVMDPPYGLSADIMKNIRLNRKNKNNNITVLNEFYSRLLDHLARSVKKKAVIMVPHFVDYRKIISDTKLKIEKEFSHYIHKNLTRKILVLSA